MKRNLVLASVGALVIGAALLVIDGRVFGWTAKLAGR